MSLEKFVCIRSNVESSKDYYSVVIHIKTEHFHWQDERDFGNINVNVSVLIYLYKLCRPVVTIVSFTFPYWETP